MNWGDFENAIHAQVKTAVFRGASGVPNANCFWAHQTLPRSPIYSTGNAQQMVVLKFLSSEVVGDVEQTVEDNPTLVAGEEILLIAKAHTEVQLQVEVVSKAAYGNHAAFSKLSSACRYLEQEEVTTALADDGIFIVDYSPIQHIPRVLETEWETRAVVTIRVRVCDLEQLTETYIETASFLGAYT